MNEAETRAEHIDPALKAAGWGVVEGSRVLREYRITEGRLEGHGRRAKADIADYVLVYRNTKLAVVEAKAWDAPLTEGVAQAKAYGLRMALRFAAVPLVLLLLVAEYSNKPMWIGPATPAAAVSLARGAEARWPRSASDAPGSCGGRGRTPGDRCAARRRPGCCAAGSRAAGDAG